MGFPQTHVRYRSHYGDIRRHRIASTILMSENGDEDAKLMLPLLMTEDITRLLKIKCILSDVDVSERIND